ncbi:MAG: hypothetical protein PHF37_10865, partial [Phycisphaerae bacterium]|nr:hypothetical protein [Phycisphaerae bacterium]
MAGSIKGITIELGGDTTKLDKALQGVNAKSRDLQSELRQVDKLLKLDPSNVTLVAQKQKLLTEAVQNTSSKLDTLKNAEKQVQEQFKKGEVSEEQYRALQREVADTEISLKRYKGQLEAVEGQSNETANATKKIGDSAEAAQAKAKTFSGGTVAAFTAVGAAVGAGIAVLSQYVEKIKEAVTAGAEYADTMNTMAAQYRISSEKLQEFSYYQDIVDVSTETFGKSLGKLTKSMGAVQLGTKQQVEAFDGLGVSIYDTNGQLRDSEDVFYDVIDALGQMENETQADVYASMILGRSFQDLNPLVAVGVDRLRALSEEAHNVGAVIDQDMLDSLNELQDGMDRTKSLTDVATRAFSAGMAPALSEITNMINEKLADPAMQAKLTKIGEAVGEIALAFAKFGSFIVDHGELIIKLIASIAAGFAAWKLPSLIFLIGTSLKNAMTGLIAAIKGVSTSLTAASLSSVVGVIITAVGVIASLVSELNKASDALENLKDESRSLSETINDTAQAFDKAEAAYMVNSEKAKSLTDEITRLNNEIARGGNTEAEAVMKKRQLAQAVSQLNILTGETVATIDEQTGLLNENTAAITKNTKEIINKARAHAYEKAYTEILNSQIEAEINQAVAIEKIKKNMDGLNVVQKERINKLIEAGDIQGIVNELQFTWNSELGAARDVLKDVIKQEGVLPQQMDYLTEAAKTNGIALGENTQKVEEATDAVIALTDAEALRLLRMQANGEALSIEQQAQLTAYQTVNTETYQSLDELAKKEKEINDRRVEIATNTNDRINFDDQTSLQDRITNLEANAKAIADYEAGLSSIREQAILDGNTDMTAYLDTLGDYSEESMGIVSQMVNDYAEGGGEMANGLASAYIDALNSRKGDMQGASYNAGSETQTSAGQGVFDNNSMLTESEKQVKSSVEGMRQIILDDGNFYFLGIGIINRLKKEIEQMAPHLYKEADNIVNGLK